MKAMSDLLDPDIEWSEDSDGSYEHSCFADDNGTDSDEAVEEANRNDDIVNILEGLW
jgi:hypothetical protein